MNKKSRFLDSLTARRFN